MSDPLDQYVTYRDFIDGLSKLKDHMDARFAQVDARFAQVDARFAQVELRFTQLSEDLARHTKTILDQVRREIALVADRFSDLPIRVTRLENAAKRRRRKPAKR